MAAESIRDKKLQFRQAKIGILVTIFWAWAGISSASATESSSLGLGKPGGYFAIIAQSSDHYGGRGPTAIAIDIIPDDSKNIVRTSAGRIISVAIFGSESLDVTAINPRTIRLNGVDIMLVGKSDKSLCHRPADINGDNYEDLVCDVKTTGFRVGEGEFKVILKAGTYNGETLQGEDRIRIVVN